MADDVDSSERSSAQYLTSRNCVHCGVKFERTGRELRKYCSDECAKERKRLLRKGLIVRQCEWCKSSIDGMPPAQKFCCESCRSESANAYNREYHSANAVIINDKAKVVARRRRIENPDLVNEQSRLWREANKEAINAGRRSPEHRAKAAARLRRRNAEDPHWRLHNRMSSAIFQALTKNKAGRKWEHLVGYTLDDLKRHLEKQFAEGMSWLNMGEWHIDHILPRAMFSYETPECPDFKRCWALTNLQPLWSVDNLKKSAKRLFLI